jgi:alpha-glucosidase
MTMKLIKDGLLIAVLLLVWIGLLALANGVAGATDQAVKPSAAAFVTMARPQSHPAQSSTNVLSGLEHVGKITAWSRSPRGLLLLCGERQTVRIDILTERLVRVRFSSNGAFPGSHLLEQWSLVKPNDSFPRTHFKVREEDDQLWLTTAQLRVRVAKSPLRVSVFDCHNRLLTQESEAPGMGAGQGACVEMEKAADERFFGLGVGIGTFNPAAPFREFRYAEYKNVCIHGTQLDQSVITLDQTGKRIFLCLGPNWSGQCMAPAVIPFFMSTRGYGIYLNEFRDSVFDLGNTKSNAWSITLGGPPNHVPNANSLDYYFLHGPSFKTILDSFTDLTGRTPLLPKWSLGYLQICHFDQKQDEVLAIARDLRQRDFPCDMLLLEPGWMKTPYRMDGWSPVRFPNPAAMIAGLQRLDFKLGLWQCGPADWVFTSWDLLKRRVNQWGVDITDPAEMVKYKGFHKPFYDQGIRFFKQDGCGQSEWQPDELYRNGLTGKEMHNIIPTLYSKVMSEACREQTGLRTINFNPMVGPSQQRYPGVWPSGDAGGGYDHFKGELNLGLSGHTYTTHDFTDRSPSGIHWSLLGPWCPGALSAILQGDMCQFYLKLRSRLIPYIYSTHRQASLSGLPYLRAMVLEYQDDPVTWQLDRQCLLGDWLLLAAYTKDVYLPAGTWVDYWSGEPVASQGEWKRQCRWPATVGGPLFVKGGAIIPMGPVTAFVDQEPLEIVRLDIYPYGDSCYTLYEDDGTTFDYENGAWARTEFRCRQKANAIRVTVGRRQGAYRSMPRNRSWLLSVHCQAEPEKVLKGTHILPQFQTKKGLLSAGGSQGWYYDRQHRTVWIKPMAGWYYAADERQAGDPEKDTVYWMDSTPHEEKSYDLRIDLPKSTI